MNKYTIYLLVFLLITEPGLSAPLHEMFCDPTVSPCNPGSCMPCTLEEKQLDEQSDCIDPNECAEVTIQKIEPPPSIWPNQPPYTNPPTMCIFCFWKMN